MASTSKVLYTAKAHVTGGRANGHGATDDGALDVQLRRPVEMGGEGGGTNPEQLFAVGYAACFEGAIGVVGRRERLEVGVELHVTLPSVPDADQAVAVVKAAHRVCPYSNATRGNIDIVLTANGAPVEAE
jgi:osmotically inducible protein OsmC